MKKEKMLIIAVLIAVFVVAWITTISAAAGIEKKKEQQEKYNEAHELLEKELYVRAIPLYEEALQINTDKNAAIESELLQAYYGHGDINKYTELVENRIKQKTASESEIISASEIYMDRSQVDDAVSLLNKGLELYDSDSLKDSYEECAFRYKSRSTVYQIIKPSINKNQLAAFNGEQWEYIDPDFAWPMNDSDTEGKYEYASSFTKDGYALVKKDGVFYVILENGDRYGVAQTQFEDVFDISGTHVLAKQEGKYSYYNFDFENVAANHKYDSISNNACGCAAVNKDGKWGIISDGGKVIVDFSLDDVALNSLGRAFSNNVAMVKKDGSWHLINNEGKEVTEQTFSDAKAPESDGYIAVANSSGLWGFIDHKGNLVIDYSFPDALSFSDGMAAVRNGMNWNYISERGNVVIEENYTSATPFHNGTAIAYSDTSAVLIQMKYVKSSKY